MRTFNEFEKDLIQYISRNWYDISSLTIAEILDKIAVDMQVKITIDKENLELIVETDDPVAVFGVVNKISISRSKKIIEIRDKVVQLLSLLDYLEKNYLVYVYTEWTPFYHAKNLNFKQEFNGQVTKGQYFGDKLAEIIISKIDNSVIASPELKEFVKNNYRDAEQIKHEENLAVQEASLRIAVAAIVVAVVATIASLIFSVIGMFA